MPLQYKIQYRWDDRGTRRRTIKKHAYANTGKLAENGPSLDRSVKNSFHGSKDGNTERIATPKSPRGKGLKGHRASGGLERVVLPAGYCLYYAPGSGSPLMQVDPQQGKITKGSLTKGLGVVRPTRRTHSVVEEEYAFIREVVEVYLENRAPGETGEDWFIDGQLVNPKKLLEEVSADQPHFEAEVSTDGVHEDNESEEEYETEPYQVTSHTPRYSHMSRSIASNHRCLLPISKALQANLSRRGPMFVKGQAVKDTGAAQDEVGELGARTANDHAATDKQPMSSRLSDAGGCKDEHQRPEMFSVVRAINRSSTDTTSVRKTNQERKIKAAKPGRRLICRRNWPLQLMSERSDMVVRNQNKDRTYSVPVRSKGKLRTNNSTTLRTNNKTTPRETARSSAGSFTVTARPPPCRPLLMGNERQRGEDRRHQHWESRIQSQKPIDVVPKPVDGKQVDGCSVVIKMPSKILLNVVLPREDGSTEGKLSSIEVTRGNSRSGSGRGQKSLQAWLSSAPSPPPPPPNSAPAGSDSDFDEDDGDDQYEEFILNHCADDTGDEESDNLKCPLCSYVHYSTTTASQKDADEAVCINSMTEEPLGICVNNTKENRNILVEDQEYSTEAMEAIHSASSVPSPTDTMGIDSCDRPSKMQTHASVGEISTRSLTASRLDTTPGFLHKGTWVTEANPGTYSCVTEKEKTPREDTAAWNNSERPTSSRRRASRCLWCGPGVCADCEASRHYQHTMEGQYFVAVPRSTVKGRSLGIKGGTSPRGQGWSRMNATPRWPRMPVGQLSTMVTDLDLCKKIVQRGHRAKLPAAHL